MSRKVMLTSRLEPELVARLNDLSTASKATVADTISLALDALEREQKAADTVAERIEKLEANVAALVDLMATFNGKVDHEFLQASTNERERLKSLLTLIEKRITEHDEAEKARFEKIAPLASRSTF